MQHVAAEVEGERLLERAGRREVTGVAHRRQLVERLVGTLDIRRVMLRVVQLEQLGRDARLQLRVVVPQIGEFVRIAHHACLYPRSQGTETRRNRKLSPVRRTSVGEDVSAEL